MEADSIEGSDDVIRFLDYASTKGFMGKHSALGRRTAWSKFAAILDSQERSPERVKTDIESIKSRFIRLNPDVTGATASEYARRVRQTAEDYLAWNQDKAKWEREASSKESRPRAEKIKTTNGSNATEPASANATGFSGTAHEPEYRIVRIPLRLGFDAEIRVPWDLLSKEEHLKIGVALLPFCKHFGEFSPSGMSWPVPIKSNN